MLVARFLAALGLGLIIGCQSKLQNAPQVQASPQGRGADNPLFQPFDPAIEQQLPQQLTAGFLDSLQRVGLPSLPPTDYPIRYFHGFDLSKADSTNEEAIRRNLRKYEIPDSLSSIYLASQIADFFGGSVFIDWFQANDSIALLGLIYLEGYNQINPLHTLVQVDRKSKQQNKIIWVGFQGCYGPCDVIENIQTKKLTDSTYLITDVSYGQAHGGNPDVEGITDSVSKLLTIHKDLRVSIQIKDSTRRFSPLPAGWR